MSDGTIPSNSTKPILSRLDRLDFIMKSLERKTKFEGSERSSNCNNKNNTNISGFSGGVMDRNNGCIPMEMASKETQFKRSLIDRVASLESRLFQLCLEMESSSTSHASSSSSGDTSSRRYRGESSSSSFPTFNLNPNYANTRISQAQLMATTTHEIEANSESEENHPSPVPEEKLIKKKKNNKQKEEENSCKREKKKIPSTWPHFKLLGC